MRDLYLRFNDAAEMKETLIDFGFIINPDDDRDFYYPGVSIDIVGVISVPGEIGKKSSEAGVVEYVNEPGYHVNLRIMNDFLNLSGLNDFMVTPKTPARVWS